MREIRLTQGKVALVDDSDYNWLNQWKWYAHKVRHVWYVRRNIGCKPNRKPILMHRLILNTPKGFQSDHWNGNGLDNQRENLRVCTASLNQHNSHRIWGQSKFRGVSWHRRAKKWMATIKLNSKSKHLGYFATEAEAARKYDEVATEHFREFASTNFQKRSR